jgi:DNA-binding transcriptional ArsR family regulator
MLGARYIHDVPAPTDQRARFQLASLGDAIGDPSRAAMLVALMGGVALPASDLARAAGVAPPTATGHLRQLLDAGLVAVRAQGRHRYFHLADVRVAAALEELASLGLEKPRRVVSDDPMSLARTCYSHFAGRVAVAFWRRAAAAGWVEWTEPSVRLLPKGADMLARRGLRLDEPQRLSGMACLDWSERVPHVGGQLGIALCEALVASGWIRRITGTRAVRLTARGQESLRSLGVEWAAFTRRSESPG